MSNSDVALRFWEKKILVWEQKRYSKWLLLNPFSWTIRNRLRLSSKIISSRIKPDWTVLELGCGSGLLAGRIAPETGNYLGIDIAGNAIELAVKKNRNSRVTFQAEDVTRFEFNRNYDLAVFLGLTDWLNEQELDLLFRKMRADNVFFSFTETRAVSSLSPYKIYRHIMDKSEKANKYFARTYATDEIEALLKRHGFKYEYFKKASFFDPGVLIWAKK